VGTVSSIWIKCSLGWWGWQEMMEQPTCAVCGKVAMQRCSRCKTEWFGIPLPAWPICCNRLFTLAETSQASELHLPFPCSAPPPLHPWTVA
jgi:hypothetical protein